MAYLTVTTPFDVVAPGDSKLSLREALIQARGSGGPGAVCGPKTEDLDDTAPFCAVGHECVNGVCQATPEEI